MLDYAAMESLPDQLIEVRTRVGALQERWVELRRYL
jgi:hypothetical protein